MLLSNHYRYKLREDLLLNISLWNLETIVVLLVAFIQVQSVEEINYLELAAGLPQ